MHILDLLVFGAYLAVLLGIGIRFFRRDESADDYYLGGRDMSSLHIGLSVVATDVGGGFSIGLGGLGFAMGIAGSWMLFTGLVGAWLSAVLLIPRVKPNASQFRFLTFPDLFGHHFGVREAVVAGIISAIGYLGFTSSQIVAGAKLASAAFPEADYALVLTLIGAIVVGYTVLGGLKAVVYTDTFQWIILMTGLIGVGIPVAYFSIGGWAAIRQNVAPSFLDLTNIGPIQLVNWLITIVPIWFVAMTLYQRIYATRSVREARRAWFVAGLFEWPVMAFMGVILGLFAKVAAEQGMFGHVGFEGADAMDPEMGLPVLLRTVLPVGVMGLLMAAYFSAIMSTADSCLLAASGNVLSDMLAKTRFVPKHSSGVSRLVTLVLGALSIILALTMQSVLSMMLYSYAFMVSGLLVPVLAILMGKTESASAALAAMLVGGCVTVGLSILAERGLLVLPFGLDANAFGLTASAGAFVIVRRTSINRVETGLVSRS